MSRFRLLNKVPICIALIYIVSSIAWVLFSDLLLYRSGEQTGSASRMLQINMELYFIGITALILYLVVKHLVNSLIASEKQYRLMFEDNPNPMWIYELKTLRFLAVNNAAVKHYGYTREEFIGMTIKDIRPREDHSRLEACIEKLKEGPNGSQVWKHFKKNGEVVYVEIIGQAINFRKKEGRLILAKDITDKLNADMEILSLNTFLVEQNEKLKEYGHIYSHRIRAPLASIMGLVSLMKEDPGQINKGVLDMMTEATGRLDTEIRRMNHMLSEIERRSDDVSR